jgi:uncharacterized protein (TIGR02231 family)
MRIRSCISSMALLAASTAGISAQGISTPGSEVRIMAESRIVDVTVYADRALVTRRAEQNLPAGESTVVFTDLPARTDSASLQVSGTGAFTLRDVRITTRQVVRDISAQARALEDELRGYAEKLEVETDAIKRAEAERLFLADVSKRLTSNAGESETLPLDTAAWAKMFDFHRSRNEALDETLRVSRKAAKTIQSEIDRINREIKSLGPGSRMSVVEAEVVLETKAATKASIDVSYIVAGPSWLPDYVVRAQSEASSISVHYRALVRQNTGEAWNDATLKLSTARPQVGGSLPTLLPWYIDVYRPAPVYRESSKAYSKMAEAPAPSVSADMDQMSEMVEEPPMEYAAASAETGATSVTFTIPGLTTVDSDNKDRTVTVAVLDLPVAYSWAAVPKLSPYAYFRALANNKSDFPFLPGASHVYVDGSYVADASMAAVPPGGEFRADLGIDEAVTVARKLDRKFDETTGVLARKSKTTWKYSITVKNGKKREINITVSDQLPISGSDQLVVKPMEPVYTKDTDTLKKLEGETFEWTLKLAPGKETVLPLSFSVEYPKGTPVTGLE